MNEITPHHVDNVNKVKKTIPDYSTRLQLLMALEQSELCVTDLAYLLNMTISAVSHQLKSLKTAKLVKIRKDGKSVFYSLDDDHIKKLLSVSLEHLREK